MVVINDPSDRWVRAAKGHDHPIPHTSLDVIGAEGASDQADQRAFRDLTYHTDGGSAYARSVADGRTEHGLTTVVFVDVEGSTALLDRVGDVSGLASVAGQLDAVSELLSEYGGKAVKSIGDGIMITFTSPRQAVLFGVASQRRLAGSSPKVRIGINTGEAAHVDGDPLGAAVNAAARIAGRADGGEVLVSDVVRLLTGSAMPVHFVDRGRCRLRGFTDRWHLWAVEEGAAEQAQPPTIGRLGELSKLDELVTSTAAGEGRVVLVEGEAGIGKTHLVGAAVIRAIRAAVTVIEVAADEIVRRPGAIAHGLMAAAPGRLGARARLAGLLEVDPNRFDAGEDLGYAVTEISVDLIEELARSKPVLLVAEDLHWADDLSIRVLTAIAARSAVSRFGVLASFRPTPRPPTLDRLIERIRQTGVHLRIGALDALDVQALASSIAGAPPGERLRRKLDATGGNPLYVTELLRSMDDDGALRIDAGVAEVAADETPADLHETLVRRLSWLPPETNDAMRIASLLGSAFTMHDVAAITSRSVVDIAGALRDAALAGLIVGDADRLSFRHELVREAVYHHMLPAERRELHRAAARSLAASGAPTQQVAEQYARGALPGDADAIRWLEQAAAEARTLEPGSALSFLQMAAALVPAEKRPAIRVRTIEPLVMLNRLDEADEVARDLLGGAPGADLEYAALRGQLLVERARGSIVDVHALMQKAAKAAGAPADERRRLRCMAAAYSIILADTATQDAELVMQDVLVEARAADDLASACVALQGLGMVAMAAGHVADSQDYLTEAMTLFDAGQIPAATFVYSLPHTLQAFNLLGLDDIDGAIDAANRVRTQSDLVGVVSPVPLALGVTLLGRFSLGRWDDADRRRRGDPVTPRDERPRRCVDRGDSGQDRLPSRGPRCGGGAPVRGRGAPRGRFRGVRG